jgi:hypothetical protein
MFPARNDLLNQGAERYAATVPDLFERSLHPAENRWGLHGQRAFSSSSCLVKSSEKCAGMTRGPRLSLVCSAILRATTPSNTIDTILSLGYSVREDDSHLEERFAREFRRVAPDWDIVREPEPIPAGETLIFPDFALHHRSDPGQRWLLEIVGFWTPDYVARKVALYQKAPVANLILCIDEDRSCSSADLPMGTRVVRFRKRVDPADVLRAVGASPDPVER